MNKGIQIAGKFLRDLSTATAVPIRPLAQSQIVALAQGAGINKHKTEECLKDGPSTVNAARARKSSTRWLEGSNSRTPGRYRTGIREFNRPC